MSPVVFVKRYADPARGEVARAHLRWLAQLGGDVPLPQLYPGGGEQLVFDQLRGRHASISDLAELAGTLGRLHGTAYASELHAAQLDLSFRTSTGVTISDFHTGRQHLFGQLDITTAGLPAAIYKDANIRNFVMTTSGPVLVDFDDLTLAPFGYDLAKLVVSTAMTYGHLTVAHVEAALDTYNRHVHAIGGPTTACTPPRLAAYAEMHHLLTIRYLHRNGYQYPWPHVRPWPKPRPSAC